MEQCSKPSHSPRKEDGTQEVKARLTFLTPCLAGIREPTLDVFHRDADGNVIFLLSWWHAALHYGADALGKHQGQVNRIRVDQRVEGKPTTHRRHYAAGKYKDHEAFAAGASIVIRALLPDDMTAEQFRQLLAITGQYQGISPYRGMPGLGAFKVDWVREERTK